MGWGDNILLATAPLGILTVIVSAIRVGGDQWLKNVIGRARESDGVAEAELMSSTSSDVCELWSRRGVVRVLGSPDISQLIYRVDSHGKLVHDGNGGIYDLEGAVQARILRDPKSSKGPTARTGVKESPNLVLNICGSGVGESELWIYAILGVVLQLSVWAWCVLTVTYFKYSKQGKSIVPYALPLTITGSILVCFGVAICSHVVEASTTEHIYEKSDTNPGRIHKTSRVLSTIQRRNQIQSPESGTGSTRVVYLQRGGQVVNDQRFEGYAISDSPKQNCIKTSRKNGKDFGLFVNLGTAITLIGFVTQFIGLRAMHWSSTIAQLLATLTMTVLRATARRGLSTPINATHIPEFGEPQWLAKFLNCSSQWSVQTGLAEFDLPPSDKSDSAEEIVLLAQRLNALINWERPSRQLAISTGRAMENIINAITNNKEIITSKSFSQTSEISCPFPISCNGLSASVNFKIKRTRSSVLEDWGQWVADTDKLEAILSLWIANQLEAENDRKIAEAACGSVRVEERHDRLMGPGQMEKLLEKSRVSLQATEYEEYRLERQKHYFNLHYEATVDGLVGSSPFLQVLGRSNEEQGHDYETWLKIPNAQGLGIKIVYLSSGDYIKGIKTSTEPRFFSEPGYWHTNFGFEFPPFDNNTTEPKQSPQDSHGGDDPSFLASSTYASADDILGLDLVAKFMWVAVKNIEAIHGVTRARIIDLERSETAFINSVLDEMAQSIVRAGLGGLQDAYNIIIPPLSYAGKLPKIPDGIDTASNDLEIMEDLDTDTANA